MGGCDGASMKEIQLPPTSSWICWKYVCREPVLLPGLGPSAALSVRQVAEVLANTWTYDAPVFRYACPHLGSLHCLNARRQTVRYGDCATNTK